jgi:hypothetical protein
MNDNEAPAPADPEVEAHNASLAAILESAGLHRCPHSRDVAFCGCAPGRCAERGEVP